jgi:hypothetical protein
MGYWYSTMRSSAIYLVIMLLGLCSQALSAQENNSEKKYRYGLSVSYFGHNGIHPGLKIAAEYPVWFGNSERQKQRRLKTIHRTLLVGANIGFYNHNQNHTGLIFDVSYGYRKLSRKTFKFEALINTGYLRTFNAGETYEVQDDGSVKQIKSAGRNYGIIGLAIGLGQYFPTIKRPFAWHARPGLTFQGPYNTSFNLFFTFEVGVTYNFKKGKQE